ncbi:5-guanidino-2-oxopentanoate decarboxylase [soil metagenome]
MTGTATTKTIRGGDAVVRTLKANGIDVVFGIPGVHTLDIYDALIEDPDLTHILARHEQGAGFMADGYARATGKPGTALIVTGPGLTNISTAVGQAYADSAPVFVIATNQERRHLDMMVGNLHELTDQLAFMKPITKWSQRAMEAADLPELVAQALEALGSGRPRPVHLEIPLDLLAEPVEEPEVRTAQRRVDEPAERDIDAASELISGASRVMIFAGGGASTDEVAPRLAELAEEIGAPVVTSVTGKGAISYDHPYCAGAFGYRWSNDNPVVEMMKDSDLVIAISTGLGVRTTGEGSMPLPAKLIQIDIDPAEHQVGKYERTVSIVADAAASIDALLARIRAGKRPANRWSEEEVRSVRDQLLAPADERAARYVPYVQALRDGMDRDAILVNDMTMLAYEGVRYFPVYAPRSYMFPRGFGTLGSAMPTALGAKVGCPDRQVVSIAGDGGFQFTLEELGAAVHHQIPVQIVIFNDGTHSAVKAAQHRTYPGRFIAVDLVNPDYIKIADAYGMKSHRAESPESLTDVLRSTGNLDEPILIDVPVDFERYEA